MRLAMWSGPRNLSTAMMYAFGNRADFDVVDEPFYASYLVKTGLNHPMRQDVIASQPHDPKDVVQGMLGPIPNGCPHVYHKHMTQHMLPEIDLAWMADVTNVFLIRHPARVAKSFAVKYDGFGADELGFRRQWELFEHARSLGQSPVVVDSSDIRANPSAMLSNLCAAIGLKFSDDMLSWPQGGHTRDGVWAQHWYGAVHRSTGFDGPESQMPQLSGALDELVKEAMPYYDKMCQFKLSPVR